MSKIERTPQNYILPLGKYKGMRLTDVVNLTLVDKDGKDKEVGKQYLIWLCKQSWFRDTEIVQKVLGEVKEDSNEEEPKPKKDVKKKQTVKITSNETLEFQ